MPHSFVRVCLLSALLCTPCIIGCGRPTPVPPQAIALNAGGAEALEAGDLEAAGARLNLALEYHPEYVDALTNLGVVELQRGNFPRAEQLLQRALRLNPDLAQPHHGLGVLEERRFRPDIASERYRAALAVDPGFAPARANLGRLLLEAQLVEDALIQFRRLREVAPHSPQAHRGYVECLLRLERTNEARSALAEALPLFSDDPGLRVLSGRVAVLSNDPTRARATLQPLVRRGDEFAVHAAAWLSIVELAEGEPQAGARWAERALDLDPENALATYAYAVALERLDSQHAPAWAERARKLLPEEALGQLAGTRASKRPVAPR